MSARDIRIRRLSLEDELERCEAGRTIDACRHAGLPVVDEEDCTCGLDRRLVVLAGPDGLRVLWPYDRPCPVHRHETGKHGPLARDPGAHGRRGPGDRQASDEPRRIPTAMIYNEDGQILALATTRSSRYGQAPSSSRPRRGYLRVARWCQRCPRVASWCTMAPSYLESFHEVADVRYGPRLGLCGPGLRCGRAGGIVRAWVGRGIACCWCWGACCWRAAARAWSACASRLGARRLRAWARLSVVPRPLG